MSEELVEKIARLLYEKRLFSPGLTPWERLWPENKEYWRNLAREVIRIVREQKRGAVVSPETAEQVRRARKVGLEAPEIRVVQYEHAIHPFSPCLECRHFVNGWCSLGVLDRFPQPLYEGKPCGSFEKR